MPFSRGRRAVTIAALAALVLHSVTVIQVYRTWGFFGRGNVIAWLDFPVSLLYVHFLDRPLLAASLLLGGLWWSTVAALLAWSLGRAVRRRRR